MAGPHIGQPPVIWDLPSYPGLIVNEGEQLSQLFLQLPHDSRMKPSSSAEHLSSDSSQSQNHKSAGDSALLRLPFDRGCHSPWWEMQIPAWTIPPAHLWLCAAHQDFAARVCGELEAILGMPGGKWAGKGKLWLAKSFSEGSAPMNRVHSKASYGECMTELLFSNPASL